MLTELLHQWAEFPYAEDVHALQGAVAGFLLAKSYLERCTAYACIALTILMSFAIYETLERWSILDLAYIDFQAALITMWISAIATIGIHIFREWRHGNGKTE